MAKPNKIVILKLINDLEATQSKINAVLDTWPIDDDTNERQALMDLELELYTLSTELESAFEIKR